MENFSISLKGPFIRYNKIIAKHRISQIPKKVIHFYLVWFNNTVCSRSLAQLYIVNYYFKFSYNFTYTGGEQNKSCDAKFSENYPYSHNDKTTLIKQIPLFDTILVMTNTLNFNSKYKNSLLTEKEVKHCILPLSPKYFTIRIKKKIQIETDCPSHVIQLVLSKFGTLLLSVLRHGAWYLYQMVTQKQVRTKKEQYLLFDLFKALDESRAVTNRIFFPKGPISFMRAQHVLRYHLI